jgi:DNA gyrase subunit A
VTPENELMLMSSSGTLVRTRAAEVSVLGRNTQGVRLIRLDEGERLIGVEAVDPEPVAVDGVEGEALGNGDDVPGAALPDETADPDSPAPGA